MAKFGAGCSFYP